jgi:hypothetical protein
VQGIDNHQIVDIPIATAGVVRRPKRGEVIIFLHQYAYTGKGKTIHFSGQLEWYKQVVDDSLSRLAGSSISRLWMAMFYLLTSKVVYIMSRCGNQEWDLLPHVVLTGDGNWNPSVLDHSLTDNEQWYDAVSDFPVMQWMAVLLMLRVTTGTFMSVICFTDSILDDHIILDLPWLYQAHEHQITKNQQDSAQLCTNFA